MYGGDKVMMDATDMQHGVVPEDWEQVITANGRALKERIIKT